MTAEQLRDALPSHAADVLLAYANDWHGANCDGNFQMEAPCSCGLAALVAAGMWADDIEPAARAPSARRDDGAPAFGLTTRS